MKSCGEFPWETNSNRNSRRCGRIPGKTHRN
jgi:hypothetical protein